ncbi:MAG: DUF5916 domain-containing protein [Bacteroidia bacterium]
MKLRFTILLFALFSVLLANNPPAEKNLNALRITEIPTIDGILDDEAWEGEAFFEGVFTQTRPNAGAPASHKTKVSVRYTDYAIYVAARMYDPEPNTILTELGLRDDDSRNVDAFAIGFDPYYKKQNAFVFKVTAAGVQIDLYIRNDDEDYNWNAVWKSAVNIDEKGWTAEMEIPLFNLRFPKEDVQKWGLNFLRQIQDKQEQSFWNPIDPNVNGTVTQFGVLDGLEGLKPPLRLQLMPYATSYLLRDPGQEFRTSFVGGADLKYGISESFTLDATLIPDFGQVRSDNVVLNLSAFEVFFDENRSFFVEGTELFDRATMFYSRRIGRSWASSGDISMEENEQLVRQPTEAPLLNAIKVSGRNKNGLGIGVFNAITNKTQFTLEDTLTKTRRQVEADPLTNFNMIVLDQQLPNNSSVAVYNTNVRRFRDNARQANVTGTDFSFFDKKNTWNIKGNGRLSLISEWDNTAQEMADDLGYRYYLELEKVSGNWQFGINRLVESVNYNSNDMGFLRAPNEISHRVFSSWQKNTPFGPFLRGDVSVFTRLTQTHRPFEFEKWNIGTDGSAQFKNFWQAGYGIESRPVPEWDHFAARDNYRKFIKPANHNMWMWFNTDSRKQAFLNMNWGGWSRPAWNQFDNWLGVRPRFRFNDRFTLEHDANFNWRRREIGYADQRDLTNNGENDVLMGRRFVRNITNVLNARYTFNEYIGLTFRARHYWSAVRYTDFFMLNEEGNLDDLDFDGLEEQSYNQNFNTFNIDMVFNWQVAPGSFLQAVWKRSVIDSDGVDPTARLNPFSDISALNNYRDNVFGIPGQNSFSIRLTYFLDYSMLRRAFNGR